MDAPFYSPENCGVLALVRTQSKPLWCGWHGTLISIGTRYPIPVTSKKRDTQRPHTQRGRPRSFFRWQIRTSVSGRRKQPSRGWTMPLSVGTGLFLLGQGSREDGLPKKKNPAVVSLLPARGRTYSVDCWCGSTEPPRPNSGLGEEPVPWRFPPSV